MDATVAVGSTDNYALDVARSRGESAALSLERLATQWRAAAPSSGGTRQRGEIRVHAVVRPEIDLHKLSQALVAMARELQQDEDKRRGA